MGIDALDEIDGPTSFFRASGSQTFVERCPQLPDHFVTGVPLSRSGSRDISPFNQEGPALRHGAGDGSLTPNPYAATHRNQMPTSKKKTTATREHQLAAAQSMVDGIAQNKASLPATIPVGTQTYKPDDVSALLQKRITAGKTVVTTASAHEDALKAESDVMAQTKLVVGTFRKLVLVLFAQSPAVLATFGLTAPKPRVVPVATKAKAASQGAAKRKAKAAAVAKASADDPATAGATPTAPATPAPKS